MTRYETFDSTPYRAHQRVMGFLRPGEFVLEIGCGSGALTAQLKALGCTVVGVEQRTAAAEKAKEFCKEVVTGDIESISLDFDPGTFDSVLLIDVLEHLVDPDRTIRRLKPLLKQAGRFLVALPNAAHWSIRLRLLFGRFDYEESGIMDRTHLHFYTLRTARQLLERAGLEILEADIVPDVPLLRFKYRLARANYHVAHLLPNLFATEALFVARARQEASAR